MACVERRCGLLKGPDFRKVLTERSAAIFSVALLAILAAPHVITMIDHQHRQQRHQKCMLRLAPSFLCGVAQAVTVDLRNLCRRCRVAFISKLVSNTVTSKSSFDVARFCKIVMTSFSPCWHGQMPSSALVFSM